MHRAHIAVEPNAPERVQTCSEHSRAVAERARVNLEPCGLGQAGYLAGLMHDCGKFTDEFDAYLNKAVRGEPVQKGSVIHTFAGVRYLLERFHSRNGELIFSDITAEVLAASVGGHHGLMDLWDEHHQNGFDHRLTRQPEYDRRAIADFHLECASEEEVQSLFQQADAEILWFYQKWIVPNVKSEKEAYFALGLVARLITSAVVDADRSDTRSFVQNIAPKKACPPAWDACVAQVDGYVAAFPKVTPIQRARCAFSEHCAAAAEKKPGLYRLDLPTGGGKTLAALRFAVRHAQKNGLRRVFYVAPLLSIIEQNAKVIRDAVGQTASVLEHHSNLLQEESSAEEIARAELLQENWDAQIVVTTLVQLLNTLFSGKMAAVRRFFCLSGSVILIDEVQSLPPKLLSMFNGAVNFLTQGCGATVLLCSATQPSFERVERKMLPCERLMDEAILRQYAPLFRRTVIRDGGSYDMPALAEHAKEILENADSLLIVCNTKREAADAVQGLGAPEDVRVFHLSAGMCMAHRKQTIDELNDALKRKEKLVCVSTQLIEAGVDVSFGAVIRLAAGLDNIVQTAGRCNRHGEHEAPQPVEICHLKNEKLGSLREIQQSQDALNALLEEFRRDPARYLSDLTSDAAIDDYYAFLYRGMARGAQDDPVRGQTLYELLSTNLQFAAEGAPSYFLGQAFRTAGAWFEVFDSASADVLVPYGEGKALIEALDEARARYDLAYAEAILRRAKPYAVSLEASRVDRMIRQGMVYPLLGGSAFALNAECYDDRLGIKEGKDLCATLIL